MIAIRLVGLTLALATLLLCTGSPARCQGPEWISQHLPGSPGLTTGDALIAPPNFGVVSDDGRYVAFYRDSDQSGGLADVFVRDRLTPSTELMSVSMTGSAGNARSLFPLISGDGRFVVFTSFADNLVPDDGNGQFDAFIRDRVLGTTEAVSLSRFGTGTSNGSSTALAMSTDASVVLFQSTASDIVPEPPRFRELYLADSTSGEVRMLSLGLDGSGQGIGTTFFSCAISDDGRRIVFTVEGGGMVADDENGVEDLFLFDRDTGETRLLSRRAGTGASANGRSIFPVITPVGRFATFQSEASDLVPGDTNGEFDVFRVDLDTGEIELVSADERGFAGSGGGFFFGPSVSDSGRFVAFLSPAPLLPEDEDGGQIDAYVRDLVLGETFLVSEEAGVTRDHVVLFPFLTPGGEQVVFTSRPIGASAPSQVLVRQTFGGPLRSVSQRGGVPGNGDAGIGFPTPDGREVIFSSDATNLGGGDDEFFDLFAARVPFDATVAIPTVSGGALLALALALLGAGLVGLRGRR